MNWSLVHNSWDVSTIYRDGKVYATVPIDDDVDEFTQARYETEKEERAQSIFDLLKERT